MAEGLTAEHLLGTPSQSETGFESIPGAPPPSEIDFPSTPPASLPDTEQWDDYPDSPALLDLLDNSEGSIPNSGSESPRRLEEDIDDTSVDGHDCRDQARAEMLPADTSTTHLTLRGSDETFLSFAVDNFFEHANVDSKLDHTHLEVLRARCSTDLNLLVELEARVLHWLYRVGS